MLEENIRVLRVVEYSGTRRRVEGVVAASIHGERVYGTVTIRAATIGLYPEILTTTIKSNPPKGFNIWRHAVGGLRAAWDFLHNFECD